MTFNWHFLGEDEFLKWVVVTVISKERDKKFEKLSEATNSWQEVDLKVSINGIELDGEHLFKRIWEQIAHLTKTKAEELVNERIAWHEIEDSLASTFSSARDSIKEKFRSLGLEMKEDDW